MKALWKSWIVRGLALMLTASVAYAQERVPFRQEELDQILAPIALYPDSLLSQMLMAATYPLEVVQAARWSRANRGLKGQDAVRAVEGMDWDPSVKSMTAFPEVLTMMDEKLDWTERLGEAFLAQQKDVMDTIQGLRQRADAAGNLRSSERMRVVREPEHIVIEPPGPEVVYVPYYSPAVVYGPWWWPAYPPVYWAPPPAYYAVPAYGPAFFWGPAIGFSAGFFFGHFDWGHRHATVVNNHITNVTVNRRTVINRSDTVAARRTAWRHDPAHRRGVPFRTAAAREQFQQARAAADERRGIAPREGASRAERSSFADTRTADLRQSRLDERRNATTASRNDGRAAGGAGRQPLFEDGNRAERAASGQAGGRAAADSRRSRPEPREAQPDSRGGQPDARPTRPEPRSAQPDRDSRPGRSDRGGAQGGDRRGERAVPGTNVTRLQSRSEESRAAVRAELQRRAEAVRTVAPGNNVTRLPARGEESRAAVRAELQRRSEARSTATPARPTFAERRAQAPATQRPAAPSHAGGYSGNFSPSPRASAGNQAPRMQAQPRGGSARSDFGAARGAGGRS